MALGRMEVVNNIEKWVFFRKFRRDVMVSTCLGDGKFVFMVFCKFNSVSWNGCWFVVLFSPQW